MISVIPPTAEHRPRAGLPSHPGHAESSTLVPANTHALPLESQYPEKSALDIKTTEGVLSIKEKKSRTSFALTRYVIKLETV